MSEKEQVEAHLPITISIDVDALLRSELGWTTYNAGDYESPEPGYAPGGDGRIIDVVAAKLAAAIREQVLAEVIIAVRERALEKVDGLIDETMNGTITATTPYGQAKAEPMSLREVMVKAMTDRLNEPVNIDGKPINGSYGRSGRTYLQWHAEQMARSVLDKEFSKRLADAANAVRTKATEIVSQRIAEALGRGF